MITHANTEPKWNNPTCIKKPSSLCQGTKKVHVGKAKSQSDSGLPIHMCSPEKGSSQPIPKPDQTIKQNAIWLHPHFYILKSEHKWEGTLQIFDKERCFLGEAVVTAMYEFSLQYVYSKTYNIWWICCVKN